MLLVLLNSCLSHESVPGSWREAWVSMIPKPYEWEDVLINTRPIALIKTTRKILSKILSNRISLVCSAHDILYGDNFSVLKGTTTQTLIFAIGLVVENTLEKNRKFWLVLQNMRKVYDSVGNGRTESQTGFFTFFAAEVFVDDTIWVGGSQAATQHILNVATRKGEFYWYLGIFLSTDGLSKPSLAKAHLNVRFFSNLVLKKVVSDKQFLYLVSAVLHPIVSYRMQFSFVLVSVCDKWDALIRKGGSLASAFQLHNGVPISAVLGESLFFKYLPSLRHYGIAFVDQLQDCHGDIFDYGAPPFSLALSGVGPVNICGSDDFVSVCDRLSWVGADSLSVYTDGSVKNLGTTGYRAGAAAFFEDINLGLGVCVQDLISSTLVELQAIALALECVPVDCSVCLFLDSQAALDACKVSWHKVKSHSGVLENDCTNSIADAVALSDWFFPPCVAEWFLLADGGIVSVLSGLSLPSSNILQMLSTCASDFLVFSALCKSFVFKGWLQEAVSIFHDLRVAGIKIADFVRSIYVIFRNDIWLVCAKHCAYMEKNGLILMDDSAPVSVYGLASRFLNSVVKLLGVTEAFGIHFGFRKSCSFFSDIGNLVSVNIIV
ncbi:hypothetical protein G9A89_001150 [Geosiphon pyriformis]|nr:hypothetical protein G9A89_001150 [Geosiphon pyriformis]